MFTLKILFVGLVAFVDLSDTDGKFFALLVDARHPSPEQKACGMIAHQPRLSFSMEIWDEGSERGPNDIFVDALGNEIGVVNIASESLSLGPGPLGPALSIRKVLDSGSKPNNQTESRDFRWIVDLDPELIENSELNPACFDAHIRPPIVARLELSQGIVKVENVGKDEKSSDYVEFKFKPDPNGLALQRALGDRVLVELEVSATSIDILSTVARPLRLRPTKEMEEVTLVISNLPLDASLYGGEKKVLKHFRWYYELLKDPPPDCSNRPIPEIATEGGGTSGSGIFCPEVEF